MPMQNTSRLGKVTLAFLLIVIVWGAYVRASGSGAGCGSHWPLCNGQVIPVTPSTKTIIEFVHRITSGVSLLLCLGLGWSAFRSFRKGTFTRKAAVASVVLIFVEALLGAGLVLLELVEENKSLLRTFSLGIHLLNTFLLLGAVLLTTRWASEESKGILILRSVKKNRGLWIASIIAVLGVFAIGVTGAMTALGDTLFPARAVMEGLREDLSPTSHFLIQLRVFHPLIAVLVSSYLMYFSWALSKKFSREIPEVFFLGTLLAGVIFAQVLLGAINVMLLAPTAIQLGHLLFADLVWILLVQILASVWVMPKEAQ